MSSSEFHQVDGLFDAANIVNAMSVDVEDYFQVAAFEQRIAQADWPKYEYRVQQNVEKILEVFDAGGIKATFFTLGWVAERSPGLIRAIAEAGHEVASHGMNHDRITGMTPIDFRADVDRSRKMLEDISGMAVRGYRAPSYSINETNLWALDVLQESGYVYSSSVYPIAHDIYGMPSAPRWPFRRNQMSLIEIPITTVRFFGRNWPCGGGGYFRLLPYVVSHRALRRVNETDRHPGIFYFHPWEIDPDQPRITGAPLRSRFRHYVNLRRFLSKLENLLRDFAWGRMDTVFHLGTS